MEKIDPTLTLQTAAHYARKGWKDPLEVKGDRSTIGPAQGHQTGKSLSEVIRTVKEAVQSANKDLLRSISYLGPLGKIGTYFEESVRDYEKKIMDEMGSTGMKAVDLSKLEREVADLARVLKDRERELGAILPKAGSGEVSGV